MQEHLSFYRLTPLIVIPGDRPDIYLPSKDPALGITKTPVDLWGEFVEATAPKGNTWEQ